MIAQYRQWSRKPAVEHLHHGQQVRLLGNPWFSGAGRHSYANADPLLQHKPGSKGTHQLGTAMIDNIEFVVGKSRARVGPRLQRRGAKRGRPQHFHNYLAGTTGAKQYEHRRSSRLEKTSQASCHGFQIRNTIQWRKIRKRAIELAPPFSKMISCKLLHILIFHQRQFSPAGPEGELSSTASSTIVGEGSVRSISNPRSARKAASTPVPPPNSRIRPPFGNTRNSARTARRCAATLCQALKRESNAGAIASNALAAGRNRAVIVSAGS